jgi:hypothetical protein
MELCASPRLQDRDRRSRASTLCRFLYALLRDGTDVQPTRLGVEEGPFTQTITRRFRLTQKSAGRFVSA